MSFLYDQCDTVETCWGSKSSNMHYDGYVKQFEIRVTIQYNKIQYNIVYIPWVPEAVTRQ